MVVTMTVVIDDMNFDDNQKLDNVFTCHMPK